MHEKEKWFLFFCLTVYETESMYGLWIRRAVRNNLTLTVIEIRIGIRTRTPTRANTSGPLLGIFRRFPAVRD